MRNADQPVVLRLTLNTSLAPLALDIIESAAGNFRKVSEKGVLGYSGLDNAKVTALERNTRDRMRPMAGALGR